MLDLWAHGKKKPQEPTDRHVVCGDPSKRAGLWLGSTDWSHIINELPYGCQRKLFLEKLGVPHSDPHLDYETEAMTRGKAMEPVIRDVYAEFTGFDVRPVVEYEIPSALPAWWRPAPDGLVVAPGHGKGALEIKNPSARGTWRTYRHEGIPPSWIMQIQSEIAALDTQWGSFGIIAWGGAFDLWNLDGEVPRFPRNQKMIDSMLVLGGRFLDRCRKGDEPEAQDHTECKACGSCPFLTYCHGKGAAAESDPAAHDVVVLDSDPEAQAMAAQYGRLKSIADDTKDALGEWKVKADALLGRHESDAVKVGGDLIRRVYSQPRQTLDSKKVKAAHPDDYADLCKVGKASQRIQVFGRKSND